MKLWFGYCKLYSDDWGDVKFGIGWYRHSKNHKWFGFTVALYLLYWRVQANFVDNYKEYDKRINYRMNRK
jgi:hypothetical protein